MEMKDIRQLLNEHRSWLTTPNVVSIDYAEKLINREKSGRMALVVGVIKKQPVAALAAPDVIIPEKVSLQTDGGLVATADNMVVGLLFSAGAFHVYGCLIP